MHLPTQDSPPDITVSVCRLLDVPNSISASELTLLWSGHAVGAFSLTEIVERNFRVLRQEILDWEYSLGRCERFDGRDVRTSLLSHFGDVSLYHLSWISEKCPLRSGVYFDLLKLRALETFVKEKGVTRLIYEGARADLTQVLAQFCSTSGLQFKSLPTKAAPKKWNLSRLRTLLPHRAEGFAFIARQMLRWLKARRSRLNTLQTISPGPTLVTYFPNVDPIALRQHQFRSRYFEDVHSVIDANGPAHWVWLYANSKERTFEQAAQDRRSLNERNAPSRYFLLDDFLTLGRWGRVLAEFLRISAREHSFTSLKRAFRFSNSAVNFWPVLERDWKSSVSGKCLAENLWYLEAFDAMAKALPKSHFGLAVWEGQGWELAATAAWRRHSMNRIWMHQHNVIRELDFRSFCNSKYFASGEQGDRPLPDLWLVNGKRAKQLLLESGVPPKYIEEAEAVRYLSLLKGNKRTGAFPRSQEKCLLVVTGYQEGETRLQLDLLSQVHRNRGLAAYSTILIKPHPFCPVDGMLNALGLSDVVSVTKESLSSLWEKSHVVYCANSTSAFLEALWLGIPAIASGAETGLNLNPLFGADGVSFAQTAHELQAFVLDPIRATLDPEYFYLDPALPRWRKLLNVSN